MAEPAQQWELFGYDTRQLGGHWRGAWRDLLWGQESPLRQRLDEPVAVAVATGETRCYQAGVPSIGNRASCTAVLLPPDIVLSRELSFPRAVEDELDAVLALEVKAHSPFPQEDTAFGWAVVRRDDTTLAVQLLIASRATVMAHLGREYDIHEPQAKEVLAAVDERMVTLAGFGEAKRESLYRKRLLRVGLQVALILLLMTLLAGAATALKHIELRRIQAMASATENEAREVSAMRADLVAANESVNAVNSVLSLHPSPHLELARLSSLLDDSVFVERFEMTGATINLRGRAADAAALMKRLTGEPAYVKVEAPRAISKVRGTQLEQFYLQITLAGDVL